MKYARIAAFARCGVRWRQSLALVLVTLAFLGPSILGCRGILGIGELPDNSFSPDGEAPGDASTDASIAPDGNAKSPEEASTGAGDAAGDHAVAKLDASAQGDAIVAVAKLTATQAALDFGTVTQRQAVTSGQVQITNVGTVATAPLSTTITGTGFSVGVDGCAGKSLAPTLGCTVSIALDTSNAGLLTGRVTVSESAASSASESLTADVVTPGAVAVAPTADTFPGTLVGSTSGPVTFTISNGGMNPTGVLTATVGGANASAFSVVDGCTGKTLVAAASCVVTITFAPTRAGPATASLVVTATPGGTGTASLSGSGLAPASLSISPTSYTFPTVDLAAGGALPTETFVVSNGGNVASGALTTGLTVGTGTATTEIVISADTCAGKPLSAMATCNVVVTFQPATHGAKTATLAINSGALVASLSGTASDLVALSVTKIGSGGGTVSDPTGAILCGAACTASFTRTTSNPVVTLQAAADTSSTFSGWSGACSGTSPTCAVTLSQAQAVTARFDPKTTLTVSFRALSGQAATLSSTLAGLGCAAGTCTSSVGLPAGTMVTLSVAGMRAGALIGWSVAGCSGASCTVTVSSTQTVYVTTTANNIVFTTTTTRTGAFGGIAAADTFCGAAAKAGGLPGSYVALLASTTAPNAFARLGTARGWVRPDGLPFGDTVASIQSNVTYYPPSLSETGGLAASSEPWTGIAELGNMATCNDWTSASSTLFGWVGSSPSGSNIWSTEAQAACNEGHSFMCFGTDLSSAVSVPPATGRHGFISANAYPVAGIPAADVDCETEALAGGLANPGNFKALLTTTTAAASTRFNLQGPTWIRPDNVVLADSPTDFMAGTLIAPITIQADGSIMPNGFSLAWAGDSTDIPPAGGTYTCNDWSTTSSTAIAVVAFPAAADLMSGPRSCAMSELLICLEN